MHRSGWLLACLVLVFSLYTRLIWINQIPGNVNPDEADTIRTYIERTQKPLWPSIISTNWNGAPAINMYLIGWGWQLTGQSLGSIKVTSIIFSSLSILIYFLAVKRLTRSPWLAFGTSLLLASDPVFMHFSRSGWENIFVAVPISATLYLFALSPLNKRQRWHRAVIFILIGALSLYLYHPGKILFMINLFFGLIELCRFWWNKINYRSTALVISSMMVGVLVCAPFFYSFLGPYRNATMGRINNVSVLAYDDVPHTLLVNVNRVVTGFSMFRGSDFTVGLNDRYSDTTHNLILPVLTILYLMGFILAIRYRAIVVLWFLLLLLPVQVFSTNSPDIARSIHLWPVIYWFMAMAVWKVGLLFHQRRRLFCGLKIASLAMVFILVYIQLNHYFIWMSSDRALKSREPAIWQFEYDDWVKTMTASAEKTGYNYGVYDWKAKTGQPMP